MKKTKEVLAELGISHTELHFAVKFLKIQPHQKIENGRAQNYYDADQIRTIRLSKGV